MLQCVLVCKVCKSKLLHREEESKQDIYKNRADLLNSKMIKKGNPKQPSKNAITGL